MKYLLDSNVLVLLLRPGKGASIRKRMETTAPEDVATSAVVRMELVVGAMRSKQPETNLGAVEELLRGIPVLPFDASAADRAAEVLHHLWSRGMPIGGNDVLIAATALARNLVLVTHNYQEFSRVSGLQIEDWQAAS